MIIAFFNDSDFTYQELVLGLNAHHWQTFSDGIMDTDELHSAEENWYYCIAHLSKPMICDKEWDKVLIDRSHLSQPNLKYDERGLPIFWYQTPEYKDIFEKEMSERERKKEEKAKKNMMNGLKKKKSKMNIKENEEL